MTANDPLRLVGATLAHKYVVDSLVRVEPHGVVYRASSRLGTRGVSVRVLTSVAAVASERRKALYHALVRDTARLNDLAAIVPAVYPTRDVGTVLTPSGEWVPYVVLDWPYGTTLRQVIADEALASGLPQALADIVAWIEPVAVALAMAHEHGIAHGDVGADHVLLADDGEEGEARVRLLDFGVARLLRGVVDDGEPTPRGDVYALAALLSDLVASANGARTGGGYTPRERGLRVTEGIEAVFARALAASPEARFATVGDLWSALRRELQLPALRTLTPTIPPDAPTTKSIGPTARSLAPRATALPPRAGRVALVALAALTGIAGATLVVSRGPAQRGVSVAASPLPLPMPAKAAPPPTCPTGMVDIPGGRFEMGSDDDLESEKPAHPVTLSRFCIDRFEVTTRDYRACSDDGDCKRAGRTNEWEGITDKERAAFDPLCNVRDVENRAGHPINCVTWDMADTYCAARGKRLPTEAEWEFAARGPDGARYPWGDDEPSPERLNACGRECVAWEKKNGLSPEAMFDGDDGWVHTAPVGSFPRGASRYGVEDVVGNVWEWVADWHGPYTAAPATDPKGPDAGERRVLRGGAWNGAYPAWVRPSFRYASPQATRSYAVGFRCAKSLGEGAR